MKVKRRLPTPVRWLLSMLSVLTLLLLLMTVVGALQPREHEVRSSVVIARPVAEVWAVLTDVDHHPRWRPEVMRVERVPSSAGLEHWREWDAYGGRLDLLTLEWKPPNRWVRLMPDTGGPFHGTWEFTLTPQDNATEVAIVEKGTVPNPFIRFVSAFMLGHTHTMQQFLTQLAVRLGSTTL